MERQGGRSRETPIPELADTLREDARFGPRWQGCWDSQGRRSGRWAADLCCGIWGRGLDGRCGRQVLGTEMVKLKGQSIPESDCGARWQKNRAEGRLCKKPRCSRDSYKDSCQPGTLASPQEAMRRREEGALLQKTMVGL